MFFLLVLIVTVLAKASEDLEKLRTILDTYCKRSMSTRALQGFAGWTPPLIEQFYALAQQRSVLPRLTSEGEDAMTLHGPVVDVEQVYHQFQLIQHSFDLRRNYFEQHLTPTIFFHYASQNSVAGEKLFNRLSNEGFRVTRQLDSSGEATIVVCISDGALDEDQFREDLIAAHAAKHRLIPIQIAPYRTTRWLRGLLGNQVVLRLFGSDEYVHLQYQKLILKIVRPSQTGKPQDNDPSLAFLLTPEERTFLYEQQVKKLSQAEKSRFSTEERQNFISLVEATVGDPATFSENYLRSLSGDDEQLNAHLATIEDEIKNSSLKQWVDRFLRRSTKQNLPPSSPSGDLNDAPFHSSTPSLAMLFGPHFWSYYSPEQSSESSRKSITFGRRPPTKSKRTKPAVLSRNSSSRSSDTVASPKPVRTKRQESPPPTPRYDTAARNARCQPMVERLKKGFEEFERFCAQYQPKIKTPVQQDITVFFTRSPFDNTHVQYRKALATRPPVNLPLKFLWNGVSEIEERVSKRNDASVLFSFEPAPSCENRQ